MCEKMMPIVLITYMSSLYLEIGEGIKMEKMCCLFAFFSAAVKRR